MVSVKPSRRAVRLLLCAALLYGSGAHWLLVQGAAWAGMVAARARTSSVAEAVTTTFDGRHPCAVCRAVRRGADADSGARLVRPAPTADLAFAAAAAAFRPALVTSASAAAPCAATPRPRVPPSPPPKSARAV